MSIRSCLPAARRFSSSARGASATPDWQALVGGRAGAERKRILFEDKYKRALEDKAKRDGVSVATLRKTVEDQLAAESVAKRDALDERIAGHAASAAAKNPSAAGTTGSAPAPKSKQSTPIKVRRLLAFCTHR